MSWISALIRYNHGSEVWAIPRRDTGEMKKVQAIREDMKPENVRAKAIEGLRKVEAETTARNVARKATAPDVMADIEATATARARTIARAFAKVDHLSGLFYKDEYVPRRKAFKRAIKALEPYRHDPFYMDTLKRLYEKKSGVPAPKGLAQASDAYRKASAEGEAAANKITRSVHDRVPELRAALKYYYEHESSW
jgi:hypothetical protein